MEDYNNFDASQKQKFNRYLYADYKGENEAGVPEGAGRVIFEMPDLDGLESVEGVRKAF